MTRIARAIMAAALLAMGGCGGDGEEIRHPRPEWRVRVDGIAPLMSPAQVKAALDAHGYRPVACGQDEPVAAEALETGDALACFEASGRPFRISLYFLDLREGRRLAVADFYEYRRSSEEFADREARAVAFARSLDGKLGPPSRIEDMTLEYRSWDQPGGSPTLPDTLSTKSGTYQAPNLSMVSMWAYGERRTQAAGQP